MSFMIDVLLDTYLKTADFVKLLFAVPLLDGMECDVTMINYGALQEAANKHKHEIYTEKIG